MSSFVNIFRRFLLVPIIILVWPIPYALAADYSVTGISLGMDIHEALKRIGSGFSVQPDKIVSNPGFTQYTAQRQIQGYYPESYMIYTLNGRVVYLDHTRQYSDCVHVDYSAPQPCDTTNQLSENNTMAAAIQKYGEPTATKVDFSTTASWIFNAQGHLLSIANISPQIVDLCNDFSEIPTQGCNKSLSLRIRPVGGQDQDVVDQIEVATKDSAAILAGQQQSIQQQNQELQDKINAVNQNKPSL